MRNNSAVEQGLAGNILTTVPGHAAPVSAQTSTDGLVAEGKKAKLAATTANQRANRLEAEMGRIISQMRKAAPGSLNDRAVMTLKELIAERVEANRSAVIAGTILTILKYRQRAAATKNAELASRFTALAEVAGNVIHKVATTKVTVMLPSKAMAPELASRASFAEKRPTKMGYPASKAATPPKSAYLYLAAKLEPEVVAVLGGLGALGDSWTDWCGGNWKQYYSSETQCRQGANGAGYSVGFQAPWTAAGVGVRGGDFFKKLIQVAQNDIPPLIATIVTQNSPPPVAADIKNDTNTTKPPGMSNPLSKIPGWVIPAGIGATAIGIALMFL